MIAALTNHLWQSTMFAVVAGLLAAALRENRAHVRYWVWFSASFKFFVPFSLLIGLGGVMPWAPAVRAMVAPSVPAVSLAMVQIAEPFPGAAAAPAATPRTVAAWTRAVLLAVWSCGFATLALTRVRGWRRIRAAVRSSTPVSIPAVAVQARSSPGLLEPAVVGLWHPLLLVPAGIGGHLTPAQLESVLAHELCHVRRRDNLTAAIHMIVEAVFWFHPLVWWIGARLVDERERACDEHVLGVLGTPQAYAEGILKICRLCVESPLACVSAATGSNVRKRIEDIMINRIGRTLTVTGQAAIALAATMALGAPLVAGMMTVPLTAQSRTAPRPEASIRDKEAALKNGLVRMRDAIDRYHADRKQYPVDLDALTREGYLSKIPVDPLTDRTDSWRTIPQAPAPNAPAGGARIYDVRSGSHATALDGTKYADW